MSNLALFTLTIIPLILTPGPDMLFILSQVLGKGTRSGILATVGVSGGYLIHSVLVALGISAIIVAYPLLFDTIRYVGVAYLLYIAFNLFRSAFSKNNLKISKKTSDNPIKKGFITSLLNPKVMLIYFAILPQFMTKDGNTVMQGLTLSFIFIALCLIFYSTLSLIFGKIVKTNQLDERKQKWIDAGSGTMIFLAATWLISH